MAKVINVSGGVLTNTSEPYDVGGSFIGKPDIDMVIMRFPFPRAITFPSSMTNSRGVSGVAATGTTTFSLKKNGSEFATMQWAAATTTATFTAASPTSFAAGDILTVVAPNSQDATLEHIGWSFAATRD